MALVFAIGTPATVTASGSTHLGTLGPGGRLDSDPVFVHGPHGEWSYTFDVIDPNAPFLRASLDLSNRDDCVYFELVAPNGKSIFPSWVDYNYVCPPNGTGQTFNTELTARGPSIGTWTLNVYAEDVSDLAFRVRVFLEKLPRQPKQLLPNLVPWTPWEFGFTAPGSDHPGTAFDRDNGPGDPTVSCHPNEEADAVDCLRFSAGVYNIGNGPLFITFAGDDALQLVFNRDGTAGYYADNLSKGRYTASYAGSGEWHPFHEHRHLSDFVEYELFAVEDVDTGALAAIGTGDKHGYCTFSQQLRTWGSAAQDHQYASWVGGGEFCHDYMALERGWGDIYRWQRPGQFVSYEPIAEPDGTMPAGLYVLRLTVDPNDRIRETIESDNVGYTLIRVVDGGGPGEDSVDECETGLGTSPWDPAKTVLDDRSGWAKLAENPGYTAPSCLS